MSYSLPPHGLQHAKLPYPSLSTRVCSNLCPLSLKCYLTISSSPSFFSFGLQSFPSETFPMSLCIMWPKYCSFSISPSEEYSDLVSFRIAWFDLLAVQWRDLCNSMKLWVMPCRAIQFGWVIVKSSDKMWSTGRRMANHPSILAARTTSTLCLCVCLCVCVSPLFF